MNGMRQGDGNPAGRCINQDGPACFPFSLFASDFSFTADMNTTTTETVPDRPNKRTRADSDPSAQAVRDYKFYIESGDCILRVEDTLFKVSICSLPGNELIQRKVHRYMLVRDSPVFSALFTLPQGAMAEEGLSDDLPISLDGERASDFHALFKYIYAPYAFESIITTSQFLTHLSRTLETQVRTISVRDFWDVVGVAHLAHNYEMPYGRRELRCSISNGNRGSAAFGGFLRSHRHYAPRLARPQWTFTCCPLDNGPVMLPYSCNLRLLPRHRSAQLNSGSCLGSPTP